MTCRWKTRANVRDYCATCAAGTRAGCLYDRDLSTRKDRNAPAEFRR
jgi:hypothetical protein